MLEFPSSSFFSLTLPSLHLSVWGWSPVVLESARTVIYLTAGYSLCWNVDILLKCIILFAPHSIPMGQREDRFTEEETKVKPGRVGRAEPFILAELSPVTAHYCPLVPSLHMCTSPSDPQCCSFQGQVFSCSVPSGSLWPYGLQHARLPYPSPTPGACSNSCPLSRWCHPTISLCVAFFSSCLQFSQHQGLFQWVSSSHHKAKVLGFIPWASERSQLLQTWNPFTNSKWIQMASCSTCFLCWETHVKSEVPRLHQVYSVA